jgi:hypothetical protein
MADSRNVSDDRAAAGSSGRGAGRRRGVDPFGLIIGFLLLVVAAVGFSGNPFWLLSANIAWIAAGAAAILGVGLVASTLPRGGSKD